jgi:hypothetical protein
MEDIGSMEVKCFPVVQYIYIYILSNHMLICTTRVFFSIENMQENALNSIEE